MIALASAVYACAQLSPTDLEVHALRGLTYIRLEQYENAISDYDLVIRANRNDAVAYNNRCWAYFKLGEYTKALTDCERSLQLAPDFIHGLDSRARVYLALGRIEDAVFDYERIIELNQDPELSQQAQVELDRIAPAGPTDEQIADAEPGSNLALDSGVRVSRDSLGFEAAKAIDGNQTTWWGSGAFAPQWIDIDLGANYVVAEIRLLASQSPTGETVHRVEVKGPATDGAYVLAHEFIGVTSNSRWLEHTFPEPLLGIRFVRIQTVRSPSRVSWREIEVIAGGPQ